MKLMDLIAVAGIGLVGAAAAVLLKQYKPEYAMLISLAAAGLIFGMLVVELIPAFSTMRSLMKQVSFSGEYIKILIKCLGICYLCELAGLICKESGQLAIASKIELAGKVAILLLCLPMFEALLGTALSLINL